MGKRKCCGTPKGKGPHCDNCQQSQSLKVHMDREGIDKQTRIAILDEVAGDLPDGAYFAMAEEFGIQIEDFLDE